MVLPPLMRGATFGLAGSMSTSTPSTRAFGSPIHSSTLLLPMSVTFCSLAFQRTCAPRGVAIYRMGRMVRPFSTTGAVSMGTVTPFMTTAGLSRVKTRVTLVMEFVIMMGCALAGPAGLLTFPRKSSHMTQ